MISINVKIFPGCVNAIGLPVIWWIHSCVSIAMCIIALLIIPETQGKTLTELSQMYSAKPKLQHNNKILPK